MTGLAASVVICAYTDARWQLIERAVGSVEAQTAPAAEIVLVIDHNEELLERARERWPAHVVVANRHGRGLSGARNTGVETACGDLVAFLDDDAAAHDRWLELASAHFDDPTVAGVGGAVVPAWVGTCPAWYPAEFFWVVGCSYIGLPTTVAPIRNPIGANMVFRRSTIAEVGGFQESVGRVGSVPVGCEETELSIRVRRAGHEILYDPDALVHHTVPTDRATVRYFVRRCRAEGRSKAVVARLAGADLALSSERAYVRRALPRALAGALRRAASGPERGVAIMCAGVIPLGLVMTAFGYAEGTLRPRSALVVEPDHEPDAARSGREGAATS